MRTLVFALASLFLCSGCAATVLRQHTNRQAGSIPDIYYQQVLDNLAMIQENPAKLPYFANPLVGRTGVHRTNNANYQLGWNLITGGATAFVGRYLVDEQLAQSTATQLMLGEWLPRTTDNPDKLLLMKFAYHKAIGLSDPKEEQFLRDYYYKADGKPLPSQRYEHALRPGWFGVGKRLDVPRQACYVGHHGHTYVWVMPEHMEDLSWFALAILDIVTISPTPMPTLSGNPSVFSVRDKTASPVIVP